VWPWNSFHGKFLCPLIHSHTEHFPPRLLETALFSWGNLCMPILYVVTKFSTHHVDIIQNPCLLIVEDTL
jgi:hypothetical protein